MQITCQYFSGPRAIITKWIGPGSSESPWSQWRAETKRNQKATTTIANDRQFKLHHVKHKALYSRVTVGKLTHAGSWESVSISTRDRLYTVVIGQNYFDFFGGCERTGAIGWFFSPLVVRQLLLFINSSIVWLSLSVSVVTIAGHMQTTPCRGGWLLQPVVSMPGCAGVLV